MRDAYISTEIFERRIADYCGAPFFVAIDSCSNALFLSLLYENIAGQTITIPSRTYMSVPCSIIAAGGKVKFREVEGTTLKGAYSLEPTRCIDSALHFTSDMYVENTLMCLSFSGCYKHLKLGKGGGILTDDEKFFAWCKKARFSGRNEVSYLNDTFTQLGINAYLLPELAVRGTMLMNAFYDKNGNKIPQDDLELEYPNLSQFSIFQQ